MKYSLILTLLMVSVTTFANSKNTGVITIKCKNLNETGAIATFPFSPFEGTIHLKIGDSTAVDNLMALEASHIQASFNLFLLSKERKVLPDVFKVNDVPGNIETTIGKLAKGEVNTIKAIGVDSLGNMGSLIINLGMIDLNSQFLLNKQKIYFSKCERED
jgi:hypothetical protein